MDDTDFTLVRELEEHAEMTPDEIMEQVLNSK